MNVWKRLRALFLHDRLDHDLADEIRSPIEPATDLDWNAGAGVWFGTPNESSRPGSRRSIVGA